MIKKPQQCVLLCGGKGNRLLPFTSTMPKPMIPCNGKPFLWHLLNQVSKEGINEFLLLTGYLGNHIKKYFGDGSKWGWKIRYSEGRPNWDTGKRIWEAQNKLEDNFILLYSDNFVPFPFKKILDLHGKNELPLTLMVSEKSPGNIDLEDNGIVVKYKSKRSKELKYVEIGYMIAEKKKTLSFFKNVEVSFSEVIERMALKNKISAFVQQDNYHSISDPFRWKKTKHYLKPKKIILLDRDGVINTKQKKGEYVRKWKNFEFIQESIKGLRALSQEGFKFIVISNQAGIKRGLVDPIDLEEIHAKMIKELSKEGIEVLDLYYCPHFIEDDCNCRKPMPAMFYWVSQDWFLRLDQTLYIGDSLIDVKAANNAGTKSIFLGNSEVLDELKEHDLPLKNFKNLSLAVPFILKHFKKEILYDYN